MKSALRFLSVALTPLGVASASGYWFVRYPRPPEKGPPDADNALFWTARREYLAQLQTKVLVRSLLVHSFCTHPWLVDYSIKFMDLRHGKSIPVLDSVIRHTFFAHFCGGETLEEAVELANRLQCQGISPLLVYSKESSDLPTDMHDTEVEVTKCIKAVAELEKPAFVAIKLSGLSSDEELRQLERDIHVLALNNPSGATPRFFAQTCAILNRYPELTGRLQRISDVARDSKVGLVLDAEIRFQGDVDSLTTSASISSLLNATGGHVWNTHQMIFKDSLEKLDQWSRNNPIKLVRGAYLTQEPPNKVIQSKQEADNMYDSAVHKLLTQTSNSLMLATHNHRSVVKAVQLLRQNSRIPERDRRQITFAQLYGMGDDITYGLVHEMKSQNIPPVKLSVVKYIPYGNLNEVLPYLVRRAEENRGMLGGSILEREALFDEIKRRIRKRFGITSKLTGVQSERE